MFRRYFLILTAVGIAACERPTAPTPPVTTSGSPVSLSAGNTAKFNDVYYISTVTDNPCNGDIVFVSGKMHEVFTITENDFTFDLTIHVNFDALQGVGVPSGARYHLNGTEKLNQQGFFVPDFAFQRTAQFDQEVVSEGNAPNLIYHITQQFSVDETTTTVTDTKVSIKCRG
ncbi:MAG: hypothetical protein ACJ79K_09610 [Gemmatimonadaceae bacterium]